MNVIIISKEPFFLQGFVWRAAAEEHASAQQAGVAQMFFHYTNTETGK